MIDLQALNSVDDALMNIAKYVKPLYYIEPINEEEQKSEFLSGKVKNPVFLYRDLEYDPDEFEKRLNSIEIPDDELGVIFEKRKKEILLENRIIKNRGDEDFVKEATIILYGFPNEQLVAYADDLLKRIPPEETEKTVPSERIKTVFEEALYEHGLIDWRVEFSDKRLTTVYPAEKKITVCRNRKFAKIDPERLKVHEIEVHVLRAANGYEQPLRIFAFGLPGYVSTEEGLASFFEELTGNTSKETMRDYAARVIAVDSVYKGLDFRQTFERLRSYGLSDDQAWNLTVRAHRAGGYIKDHIYLDGYRKVKKFAETIGDFKTLYVGKIGIEDLPLIKKYLDKGILKEAIYKPKFIEF